MQRWGNKKQRWGKLFQVFWCTVIFKAMWEITFTHVLYFRTQWYIYIYIISCPQSWTAEICSQFTFISSLA